MKCNIVVLLLLMAAMLCIGYFTVPEETRKIAPPMQLKLAGPWIRVH